MVLPSRGRVSPFWSVCSSVLGSKVSRLQGSGLMLTMLGSLTTEREPDSSGVKAATVMFRGGLQGSACSLRRPRHCSQPQNKEPMPAHSPLWFDSIWLLPIAGSICHVLICLLIIPHESSRLCWCRLVL